MWSQNYSIFYHDRNPPVAEPQLLPSQGAAHALHHCTLYRSVRQPLSWVATFSCTTFKELLCQRD